MAQLIDTSIFIAAERGHLSIEVVTASLGEDQAALAAVTAAELLAGVHQSDSPQRREQREAFVEQVLLTLPIVPFDLAAARLYSRLGADLRRAGLTVGVHDLQIAACAIAGGYDVLTHNRRDFDRVPGLTVHGLGEVGQQ